MHNNVPLPFAINDTAGHRVNNGEVTECVGECAETSLHLFWKCPVTNGFLTELWKWPALSHCKKPDSAVEFLIHVKMDTKIDSEFLNALYTMVKYYIWTRVCKGWRLNVQSCQNYISSQCRIVSESKACADKIDLFRILTPAVLLNQQQLMNMYPATNVTQ